MTKKHILSDYWDSKRFETENIFIGSGSKNLKLLKNNDQNFEIQKNEFCFL